MPRPVPIAPGPGQESVWAYPRPPRLEPSAAHIRIEFGGVTVADTRRALRVLETSHPPVYYIPPQDVQMAYLHLAPGASYCEWKGEAAYYSVTVGERSAPAAVWTYPQPDPAYAALAGYLAFYPSRMDACFVDDERVRAQPGDFYGGWITAAIVGPFKGDPGTLGW